ncbi:MAG: hypothetical protein JEZ05_04280 [Tenericutes bacterium]|nr:hypothetical protein [Mycoplasmatota bacterium]
MYFINLFIPFYYGVVFSTRIRVNISALKGTWIYLLVFLVPVFAYLFFALSKKLDLANKIFKIHTILTIIMFFWFILLYLVDTSGVAIRGLSLGFFMQVVLVVGMSLLSWREDKIMGLIYKLFKVPDIEEVEYIEETEKKE